MRSGAGASDYFCMSRILIVAYGNPDYSDDGLAWAAAKELSETVASPEVEIITRHQLTPELADDLGGKDVAIFINAARSGEPGDLNCAPVVAESENIYSHQLSPAGVLALAQELDGMVPRAFSISLCGQCFDRGENLSERVETVLPTVIALVEQLVSQFLRESEPPSFDLPR
jgi:hydrogenase maturation protease